MYVNGEEFRMVPPKRQHLFILVFTFSCMPLIPGCLTDYLKPNAEIYIYELAPLAESALWPLCHFHGHYCDEMLNLTHRIGNRVDRDFYGVTCCWRCRDGHCMCDERFWPGKLLKTRWKNFSDQKWCDKLRASDFKKEWELDKILPYRTYLDWLIRTFGESSGISKDDVRLWGSMEEPPITNNEKDAAKTQCNEGVAAQVAAKYVIYVYIRSHTGRTRADFYNTIAHEFKHVLQFEEHGTDADDSAWESEAENFANGIAPPCN